MYTDSDSDEEAPLVIRKPAPAARTAEPETRACAAPLPEARASSSTLECTDLSEEYLERCAVLVDFMSLFPDDVTSPVEENPVVEGFVRLVRYPLCGRNALAFGDRSLLFAPRQNLGRMTRNAKSTRMASLDRAVENVHGVAPKVWGGDTSPSWNDFYVVMQEAYEEQKTSRTNVCIPDFTLDTMEMRLRVQSAITTVLEQATQCCQEEDVAPAVAFLTPANRVPAVQHALLWFQQCYGVTCPPYRIFTLEMVAGVEWEALLRSRFSRFALSRACPLHSRTVLNQFGNPFHCCAGTVLDLHRVVRQAAEMVEASLDAEAYRSRPPQPAPTIERDEG